MLRSKLLFKSDSQRGFTLIEIMVAMMIFLTISAGVAGTLTAGLRSTVSTRIATRAKAVAQQQIEEMRSRVFYVPYSTNPETGTITDIDLLDRYFPNMNANHESDDQGWQGWYTASGDDAYYTMECAATAACAQDSGITRTVITRFINNQGDLIIPYSYDTDVLGDDIPPSNLVSVQVITSWADRSEQNTYEIDSMISATGQTVQGAGDATGEQGCTATSRNYADTLLGKYEISVGSADPYSALIDGNFGESDAEVETGCEEAVIGQGTGGQFNYNGMSYQGAFAQALGPPSAQESRGPTDYNPLSGFPSVSISSSYGSGTVQATDFDGLVEGEGEASVLGLNVSIGQVDGWGSMDANYIQWDFINPVVRVVSPDGGQHNISSDLSQDALDADAVSMIEAPVSGSHQQIEILPLQAKTSNTPSALQGLIFIRNFNATATSHAGSPPATNTVPYSVAVIGMFNPAKAASCAGDDCYDLYQVSTGNEISCISSGSCNTLQGRISLNNNNYKLQKELFTYFRSMTWSEIDAATSESADSASATVNIEALIKITAKFGTEVRMRNSTVTLMNQQGIAAVSVGAFNTSLNEAS
jgi:prepilin-type N-terminal cleavage/methylation domain-containing protein